MNKPNVEQICKILRIGKATYYRYKKSDEAILKLINYFSKEDLEELITNGKINRLENPYNSKIDELEKRIIKLEKKVQN